MQNIHIPFISHLSIVHRIESIQMKKFSFALIRNYNFNWICIA